MSDQERHQRELNAALNQIKEFQQKAAKQWRLDVPLWKLALEGLGWFVLAFLVGLGLGVIYRVFGG